MSGEQSKHGKYAVQEGRQPGVYNTWPEAKEQVSGYPGAIYKGFPTQDQAEKFSRGEPTGSSKDNYGYRAGDSRGITNDYGNAARQTTGVPGGQMKNFPNRPDRAYEYSQSGNQGGSQQNGNY